MRIVAVCRQVEPLLNGATPIETLAAGEMRGGRGMSIDVIADGLGFTEGPVCLPDGRIALVSISHACVYIVESSGRVERFATGGGPNGLALGGDGSLYIAQNGGVWGAPASAAAGIQALRSGRVEYVVDGMGAPNDCVFGPDGRLWVTDTVAEFEWGDRASAQPGQVWAVDVVTGTAEVALQAGPLFLNGLAFSPDGDRLLVTGTLDARLSSYEVVAGALGEATVVHSFAAGHPDGLAISAEGVAWVALTTADAVAAIGPDGSVLAWCDLPAGSLPTNVCIAHDPAFLYVTAAHAGSVLRVQPPTPVSTVGPHMKSPDDR
jgi:gluconolactonase